MCVCELWKAPKAQKNIAKPMHYFASVLMRACGDNGTNESRMPREDLNKAKDRRRTPFARRSIVKGAIAPLKYVCKASRAMRASDLTPLQTCREACRF